MVSNALSGYRSMTVSDSDLITLPCGNITINSMYSLFMTPTGRDILYDIVSMCGVQSNVCLHNSAEKI